MDQRSVVMLGAGLWGLLALAAVYFGVGWVERDLTLRTRAELAGAGQRWAGVQYNGRDAVLAGVAPSVEARAHVVALVRTVPGVRAVHDQTTVEQVAAE